MERYMRNNWVLWFMSQPNKYLPSEFSKIYEEGLVKVCEIQSESCFAEVSKYLIKPSCMKNRTMLYVFRERLRPLWEEHKNGGCLVMEFEKSNEKIEEYWERCVDACGKGYWKNQVVGIALISRGQKISLQIWIGNAKENYQIIKEDVFSLLQNDTVEIRVKYHDLSLQSISQ